jgi:hypothetical protein
MSELQTGARQPGGPRYVSTYVFFPVCLPACRPVCLSGSLSIYLSHGIFSPYVSS